MAGYAYEIPNSETGKIALRDLAQMAEACMYLAEEIGLYISGERGEIVFRDLAKTLNRHVKD